MRARFIPVGFAIALAAQSALAQANPMMPPRPAEITATGRGEVSVTPDRATVMVSVETRAASAAAAAAENSAKMATVQQSLRRAGLAPSDVMTFGYSVGQDPRTMMRVGPDAPRGPIEFLARNTVRATIRRIDDVGKVIDAALAGGATSISSVQMTSPNTDDARRTALSQAAAQAQRDAETLARAAGGSLGRLLSMSSSPIGPFGSFGGDSYAMGSDIALAGMSMYPTMFNPRDVMVSVTAFGRWEFIPGPSR